MQQLRLPAPEEEDERFGERGFEEGHQVRGAKFGGGPGRCPTSPFPPTLNLRLVEKEGEEQMEGNVPVTPDTWDQGGGRHLDLRLLG